MIAARRSPSLGDAPRGTPKVSSEDAIGTPYAAHMPTPPHLSFWTRDRRRGPAAKSYMTSFNLSLANSHLADLPFSLGLCGSKSIELGSGADDGREERMKQLRRLGATFPHSAAFRATTQAEVLSAVEPRRTFGERVKRDPASCISHSRHVCHGSARVSSPERRGRRPRDRQSNAARAASGARGRGFPPRRDLGLARPRSGAMRNRK